MTQTKRFIVRHLQVLTFEQRVYIKRPEDLESLSLPPTVAAIYIEAYTEKGRWMPDELPPEAFKAVLAPATVWDSLTKLQPVKVIHAIIHADGTNITESDLLQPGAREELIAAGVPEHMLLAVQSDLRENLTPEA